MPYLISEINNGFPNFINAISLRNRAKPIIPPPQIWSILFFPTNEPNANYGNSISAIFKHWFNGDVTLIFSFIFYIVSVIIGLFAFILLLKDFFQKKLEDKENLIFKESALIYFLYIIITIILFMILNLGSARARYFLNIYPLTFIPIIYLAKKIEGRKIFNLFLIFILFNPLAVYIEMKHFYNNEAFKLTNNMEIIYSNNAYITYKEYKNNTN